LFPYENEKIAQLEREYIQEAGISFGIENPDQNRKRFMILWISFIDPMVPTQGVQCHWNCSEYLFNINPDLIKFVLSVVSLEMINRL
jgi:hypothetical protein